MTAVMVLGAEVLPHDGFNVLNLINVCRITRLVVVVPDGRTRQRVVINETLAHFFFFDIALWVLLAGIFLPTFEKLIDGGTG